MNHKGREGHEAQDTEPRFRAESPLTPDQEAMVRDIIGAAIDAHKALGPGFLEGVYDRALPIALLARGLPFERQREIPITFKGEVLCTHRLDLVVANLVVVEIKAVKRIRPIHRAQILSYLKASNYRVGLLMNFNVKLMVEGIERFVR